jgi:thiol-disulfide isomerase/thioredoxin
MMKKASISLTFVLVLSGSVILINSCKLQNDKNDYLRKVLFNLEQIKSAAYFSTISFNPPGDTTGMKTYYWYKKEYVNPADTNVGSRFVWFYPEDTSRMYLYYDGTAQAYVDYDQMTISIDSFQTGTLTFRPVSSPFFTKARNIIQYALETNDTISTEVNEFGDSVRFSLYIPHKVIFFLGKPVTMDYSYLSWKDSFSRYEIWINRSDGLPYKIMNKTPYSKDLEICSNADINSNSTLDFRASEYFPPDFEIKVRGKQQTAKKDLTGQRAREWILTDYNGKSIALRDVKSKVLVIEFTGIGCAPCHAAIPFIKQLVSDNRDKDFELISIETWGSDIEGLKRYYINNGLNYSFLKSTKEVTESYQVNGVPSFFILDKERVIRKIIRGYDEGTTGKEIRDAVNELI